jgi:hypothetical protein
MTKRRRQVLGYLADRAAEGERITLGRLVRACGIYDKRTAKRVLRDLKAMGHLV